MSSPKAAPTSEAARPSAWVGDPAPRRRGLPLVGGTLAYVRDPHAFMVDHYRRFGPVSEMGFLGKRWTVLLGPDATSEALRNPKRAFASGPGWNEIIGPFFTRGLMLLDFEEHHQHRRLLQEAFTRPRLERYVAALGPASAARMDTWTPDPRFPVYPTLKDHTLHLATEIFMGGADLATAAEYDRLNDAFVDCVQAATSFVRLPIPGTRWGRALRGRALLEEFLGRFVADRRAGSGEDLFSVLCRIEIDGERFSDTDVINHMIFLLMAAHDTSTSTLSTAVRHLGQHPHWQERLRESARGLPDSPSLAELEALSDFDLVIRESLRILPPVPVLARRTVQETEIAGVRIPADRLTAVMVHLGHHLPEYWTDPERFDPERFSPERAEDRNHRHAWEPFGGGVHKCLGMVFSQAEVKLVLHQLLRRFTWRVDPGYTPVMNNLSLPFPRDGLPVELAPLR